MGKVVTREWWNVKVLSWNLHSFRLLEIIHVLDSIAWVRCASGNISNLKAHSGEKPLCPNYLLNFNHHCFVCIISHIHHVRSVS